MKNKKAFTLVELIVVITILGILGTIAFISLQGYSRQARDSKRLTDVRSLLTKLNIEQTNGKTYLEMLNVTKTPHDVTINGGTFKAFEGPINFTVIRENPDNFKDPDTGAEYEFATSSGTVIYDGKSQFFNFIEGRYWSEKNNEEVLMGNYYQYKSDLDSQSLFDGSLTGPATPPVTPSGSCASPTPSGVGIDSTNIGSPTNPNTAWTEGTTGDCTYKCKANYSGTNCETYAPPLGIILDGNDIIISDGTDYIVIADRNLGASSNDYTSTSSYGNYYQWGNNRAWSSDIGTSISWLNSATSGIDPTSAYDNKGHPGYAGNEMIVDTRNYDWAYPQNDNLWQNIPDGDGVCKAGYHIPTGEEWNKLFKIWCIAKGGSDELCTIAIGGNKTWADLTAGYSNLTLVDFQSDLKLPRAGYQGWHGTPPHDQGIVGRYWSTSPNGTNADYFYFISANVIPQNFSNRAAGYSLRCFKN